MSFKLGLLVAHYVHRALAQGVVATSEASCLVSRMHFLMAKFIQRNQIGERFTARLLTPRRVVHVVNVQEIVALPELEPPLALRDDTTCPASIPVTFHCLMT